MIQLTDNAASKVRQTMEKHGVGGLRVGVKGGGCSGLSYVLRFEQAAGPKDHVLDFGGAKVFVDPRSVPYVEGMAVDYKETLLEQNFVFFNPKAQKTCSCGLSFST